MAGSVCWHGLRAPVSPLLHEQKGAQQRPCQTKIPLQQRYTSAARRFCAAFTIFASA